jgi:hypothetical protein
MKYNSAATRTRGLSTPLTHKGKLKLEKGRAVGSAENIGTSFAAPLVSRTLAGSMELVRSTISIVSGLPRETVRSAPAIIFSGPAQRSLTLRPARSRSRQATLSTESSDSFVASAAASIVPGGANQSRAGVAPAEVQRLSRPTVSPDDRILVPRPETDAEQIKPPTIPRSRAGSAPSGRTFVDGEQP